MQEPGRGFGEANRTSFAKVGETIGAATRLGNHGRVMWIPDFCELELIFGEVRASVGADFAGGPGLSRDPVEGVRTITGVIGGETEVPLGIEFTSDILHSYHVTLPGEHPGGARPVLTVVRSADQDGRKLTSGAFRKIEVGGEFDAVAHGHAHVDLDADSISRCNCSCPQRHGGRRDRHRHDDEHHVPHLAACLHVASLKVEIGPK